MAQKRVIRIREQPGKDPPYVHFGEGARFPRLRVRAFYGGGDGRGKGLRTLGKPRFRQSGFQKDAGASSFRGQRPRHGQGLAPGAAGDEGAVDVEEQGAGKAGRIAAYEAGESGRERGTFN